jgi:2-polyprenyl-6-methoxyphenol hydroxylase-like FAD-dependent oxidoreductase
MTEVTASTARNSTDGLSNEVSSPLNHAQINGHVNTPHSHTETNRETSHGSSLSESRPIGSYPKSGIDIVIVGTGFAGLTAAMECVRKGHSVRVLERNASINTTGDMYFMGLPATRFFKHWPEMAAEYETISVRDPRVETYKHSGELMVPAMPVAKRLAAQGLDPNTPPGTFQMRPLVYKIFLRQVERLGVEISYNSKVVDYHEEDDRAACITDDGRRFEADIVIAADGVGSKSQKIVGGQVRARSSGRAMWRAAFPIEHLDQNPEVKEFFSLYENKYPIVRTWLGSGTENFIGLPHRANCHTDLQRMDLPSQDQIRLFGASTITSVQFSTRTRTTSIDI